MPRSPLTKFIAFAIVLLFVAGIFAPLEWSSDTWDYALTAVPFLVAILGWSTVRDAPVFSDRAFHRTLPPGDAGAFRSILFPHVLVLAGISVAAAIYCFYFNFGWASFEKGILTSVLPMGSFMTVFGIGASFATSPGRWRLMGFVVIFASPFCAYWLFPWVKILGFGPDAGAFSMSAAVLLVFTIFYVAIWWLIAVRRRKVLGLIFGAYVGLLAPWGLVFAGEIATWWREGRTGGVTGDTTSTPAAPSVKWHRKSFPDTAGEWIPVTQVLGVSGLEKGEIGRMRVSSFGWNSGSPAVFEVGSKVPWAQSGKMDASLSEDGSLQWGSTAILGAIRGQLPPFETITYWNAYGEDSSVLSFRQPGDSTPPSALGRGRPDYELREFKEGPWKVETETYRYELVGSFDLLKGGTCRIPSGGRIFFEPMGKIGSYSRHPILIKECVPRTKEYVHWVNQEDLSLAPLVVLADRAGKHAYAGALEFDQNSGSSVWLGLVRQWFLRMEAAGTPAEAARIESLKGGRAYVFLPKAISPTQQGSLPPP